MEKEFLAAPKFEQRKNHLAEQIDQKIQFAAKVADKVQLGHPLPPEGVQKAERIKERVGSSIGSLSEEFINTITKYEPVETEQEVALDPKNLPITHDSTKLLLHLLETKASDPDKYSNPLKS